MAEIKVKIKAHFLAEGIEGCIRLNGGNDATRGVSAR